MGRKVKFDDEFHKEQRKRMKESRQRKETKPK